MINGNDFQMKRLQVETAAELDPMLPAILDRAFMGELLSQRTNCGFQSSRSAPGPNATTKTTKRFCGLRRLQSKEDF
jgi:hypothetical protein